MLEEIDNTTVDNHAHTRTAIDSPVLKYILLAVGLLYIAGSLYLIYTLKTRLDALDQKQQTLEAAQAALGSRLHATSSEFRQALSSQVGMTKAELAKRSAELERQQRASAAKLSEAQSQQSQQIAAV